MDRVALEQTDKRRRPATKLGRAVQWGTVRMLGVFLTEDPTAVPARVAAFVAEQLGVAPEEFAEYGQRQQTVYEHAWEIRELLGYRDFAEGEDEFGRQRGATWLNVVNDQVMGIGGLIVPGTLRDSLFILDAIHTLDGGLRPETVVTDTASYSDIVFGLFAICGYQFSPRIADLGDTRLWRTNTRATYGPLDAMSRHTIRLDKVRSHWADMLRVAGSLTTGAVRAYDLIRMLQAGGRPTGLGEAFAHYGRIFKTLHLLQFISDDAYRRMIGTQLNVQEARHRLARRIAFGNRGQLRQRYREGMEDRLGALGLALNAVVWWNTLYLDAAVKQIRADGFPVTGEMCSRLSPIAFEHINFLGRYSFTRADPAAGLRPFHDPATAP
ncbi:Tn3 family transposase [Planomonospora sp. ID91781]|nr:Tn3 family transposase [Planomonospora sp. ID91781]